MGLLELKFPPLIVGLAAGLIGWALAYFIPAPSMGAPGPLRIAAVVFLVALGLSLAVWAVLNFRSAATTVNPVAIENTTSLVVSGPYKWTRNPMYVGMAVVVAAFGLWLGHWSGMVAVAAFVAFITRFQIIPEERMMREKFGPAFDDYCARVPRWLIV